MCIRWIRILNTAEQMERSYPDPVWKCFRLTWLPRSPRPMGGLSEQPPNPPSLLALFFFSSTFSLETQKINHSKQCNNVQCQKRKDKRSDIVLETKPKRYGNVSEFLLLKTDCFHLVQNLLSWTKQKGSFSMGQIRERIQSFFVSFLLDIGTFVERLLPYCFDITSNYVQYPGY